MVKQFKIATTAIAALFTVLSVLSLSGAAQAQTEPQLGAINTSRSNIKNTFREAQGLRIYLKTPAGVLIATRVLTDADGDGTISDAETAFSLGLLPVGDYVVSLQSQISSAESSLRVARITITGTADGNVEKDWNFETNKLSDVGPAESQRNKSDLKGQLSDLSDKVADGRAAKLDNRVNQMNDRKAAQSGIAVKSDGKSTMAGRLTLPNGGVVIKSISKPS